jgi:hypothetical protein
VGPAESLEMSNFAWISSSAGPPQKVPPKIAVFCGLPAVAAGIPALSLEIQKFRRNFLGIA